MHAINLQVTLTTNILLHMQCSHLPTIMIYDLIISRIVKFFRFNYSICIYRASLNVFHAQTFTLTKFVFGLRGKYVRGHVFGISKFDSVPMRQIIDVFLIFKVI